MQDYTTLYDIAEIIVEQYKMTLSGAGIMSESPLRNFVWTVDYNGVLFELKFNLPKEWYWVEYGRRPSAKMPPVDAIMGWIEARKLAPKAKNGKVPSTKQFAFAVAKKIQKEGYYSPNHRGKFPLQKAIQNSGPYIQALCEEMSKLLQRDITEDLVHLTDGMTYIRTE